MKKKIIIALVIVSVLVLAVAVFFLTRPKSVSMEKMFPAGAYAYLRLSHVEENLGKFTQSDLGKSLFSIDLFKVMERNGSKPAQIKNLKSAKKEVEDFFANPLARKFFGQELAAGMYGDHNELLFAARLGLSLQMAELAVSTAHQWSDDVTTTSEDYKGVSISHIHFKKKKIDVEYVRIHDVLFVALSPTELLHQVVDISKKIHPSLALDPDFAKNSPYIYLQGQGIVYVRIPKIYKIFKDYLPALERAKFDRALGDSSGLRSYVISYLPGETTQARMLVSFEHTKGYWNALLNCPGTTNASLKFIPHNVEAYHWGSCYDFNEMLTNLKEEVSAQSDNKDQDKIQKSISKAFKFVLRENISPLLGTEAGVYLNDVDMQGAFPYPRAVAFIKIANRPNMEHLIAKMTKKYSFLIQEEEYQKNQIHYVTLPLGANMDPGYMFLDHYLLVGTSRELLKTSADAFNDPNQSITSNEDLKDLKIGVPLASQGVVFIKINDVVAHLEKIAAWYNKVISAQIEGSMGYEQGIKEQTQQLDEQYLSNKKDLILAQQSLERFQSKANSDISADERVENQSNIEHVLADIKGMEEAQSAYEGQKERIQQMLISYQVRLESAKLWLFNFDEVIKPLLNGLESMHDLGIKFQLNNQVFETELLIK